MLLNVTGPVIVYWEGVIMADAAQCHRTGNSVLRRGL